LSASEIDGKRKRGGEMAETNSIERFKVKYRKSRDLYERSLTVSRGMNHDSRYCIPFPIVASHAKGSRKWDVDGNEHIDYSMGHGALLFGHAHPNVVSAVSEQIAKGNLFAHEHELDIELAELINKLMPAAGKIEFVSTGNEANIMIAQIARAYTGRHKLLKFEGHSLGWNDEMDAGSTPPFDRPRAGRLPPAVDGALTAGVMVIPQNEEALEQALAKKDVAALFVESGQAHSTGIAVTPEIVHAARKLTKHYGSLLVLDEILTGFRWSPGGYQKIVGVKPDLFSLAKILGGGMPIGAVCGSNEVMEMLKIKPGDLEWNRYRRVPHGGSYNGNTVSVAAGISVLKMAASGEPQKRAEAMAERLCSGMNQEIEKRDIEACAFHYSSILHLFFGKCRRCDRKICLDTSKISNPTISEALNRHMLLNGVHIHRGVMGCVSAVHTAHDIDETIDAFSHALDNMIAEGEFTKSK